MSNRTCTRRWGLANGAGLAGLVVLLLLTSVPASASRGHKESWSVVPSPNEGPAPQSSQLLSISCPSAKACMAVGTYRSRRSPNATLAEYWDGKTWSIVPSPNVRPPGEADVLNSVSCTSVSACAAVGAYFINLGANEGDLTRALTESWDGKTWSIVPSPNVASAASSDLLSSVACTADRACVAVGYRETARSSNPGTAQSGRLRRAQTWGLSTRATSSPP